MPGPIITLKSKSEFNRVFAARTIQRRAYLTLRYRKNNLEISRLGIIISKRQVKRAVDRNRIRRIIKERFRLTFNQAGYDCVFLVFNKALDADNGDIALNCDRLLTAQAMRGED